MDFVDLADTVGAVDSMLDLADDVSDFADFVEMAETVDAVDPFLSSDSLSMFDEIDVLESNIDTDLDLYTNYTPEEYVNIGEQYNVAFGADKITVHQEGNISREIELYIEKVAGTSHSWNVRKEKNGKIIATINSLTNGKFYIPGFGTGVL